MTFISAAMRGSPDAMHPASWGAIEKVQIMALLLAF